jgi:hypothetical protein
MQSNNTVGIDPAEIGSDQDVCHDLRILLLDIKVHQETTYVGLQIIRFE